MRTPSRFKGSLPKLEPVCGSFADGDADTSWDSGDAHASSLDTKWSHEARSGKAESPERSETPELGLRRFGGARHWDPLQPVGSCLAQLPGEQTLTSLTSEDAPSGRPGAASRPQESPPGSDLSTIHRSWSAGANRARRAWSRSVLSVPIDATT